MTRKMSIDSNVFELLPTFRRLIFEVNLREPFAYSKKLENHLMYVSASHQKTCLEDERIKIWEGAHKTFGSNPNKYMPSIKALIKRCRNQGSLPYINSLVAMMNLMSLKFFLPVGGDSAIKLNGNIKLTRATGEEIFVPLVSPNEKINPSKGEVIYVDDSQQVMCRRLNWQNGYISKLDASTRKVFLNIDFLDVGLLKIKTVASAGSEIINEHCDAEIFSHYLGIENPSAELHF